MSSFGEFSTQDTSFVSKNAFCKQGVACASAGVSAVIVKFCIAKATLKTNPNLAPVRKIRNSSCCVQDESWCFANLKCKAHAGTGAWRMGVFAKRKWKQGWRVSGNASALAMPKNVSPVDRSDYRSNRISPGKVQLEPQVGLLHFLAGFMASQMQEWGGAGFGSTSCVPTSCRDPRAVQGFERKTRHQQKQNPVYLLGSGWPLCLAKDDLFPPCLERLRRKPQFLLSGFGDTHTHTALACNFVFGGAHEFHGFSFLPFPWVEYPSCSILTSPVTEGYLCSNVEHIREQKPRRMGSQLTAVCKGGGDIYIYIYM